MPPTSALTDVPVSSHETIPDTCGGEAGGAWITAVAPW